MKGSIQKAWGELINDDMDQINGDRKNLAGKLQERYGWAQDEVEDKINTFTRDHDVDDTKV